MTEPWPSISVIVPVFNGGGAVKRLASSLLAQDYPGPKPEILFVDNGSTDGAFEGLKELPVTLLSEPKRGAPAARNAGARAASGEILAFTDHDCLAERRWLKRLAEALQESDAPAAAGDTIATPGDSWCARYLSLIRHNSAEWNLDRPVFPFAPTANLAVRRSVFEALEGFDEALPYTDDADFCLRIMRSSGRPIQFASKAIVFHEERSTTGELFRRYREYGRGWADLLLKHKDEMKWNPGKAWRANLDVIAALARVAPGFLQWRLRTMDPMDFHFRRFEFLRRLAHRIGFLERAISRGHLLW
jgi:GT2 family glycosyltransferase